MLVRQCWSGNAGQVIEDHRVLSAPLSAAATNTIITWTFLSSLFKVEYRTDIVTSAYSRSKSLSLGLSLSQGRPQDFSEGTNNLGERHLTLMACGPVKVVIKKVELLNVSIF